MEFFVTLNNNQDHHWQAELLIESFKLHGLQDKLHITLIPTEFPVPLGKNLRSHKRVEQGANFGHYRGFERLNKLYSMLHALTIGTLKQPFLALEPDMVLFQPILVAPYEGAQVIFQASHFLTHDLAKENIPNLATYLPNQQWIPLGKAIYFNNIPIEFFHQAIRQTEFMAYEQLRANKPLWEMTDRVAWGSNIMSMIGAASLQGTTNLEQTMTDNTYHTLINYEAGFVPHFSKKMFSYAFSLGNPFDILMKVAEIYPTTSTEFLGNLAKRLL
jgi:hypothetical protein